MNGLNGRLPRDFIIGAAKSGTTALAETLAMHPSVYLPPEKEVGFFSNDELYGRGAGWYAGRFAPAAPDQVLIDASTQYIFRPEAPQRMLETLGRDGVRSIVALLRHPVDRAYSSYWQALSLGWLEPETSFETALEREETLTAGAAHRASGRTAGAFVGAGEYADRLEGWFAAFGRERCLILLKDDFDADADAVYRQVLARLGLDLTPALDVSRRVNVASLPRNAWLNAAVRGRSAPLAGIRKLLPRDLKVAVKKRIDGWNRKPIAYAPMRPETRAVLLTRFGPEIDRLEALLNRDLSEWRK